jgi:hypothetical protein
VLGIPPPLDELELPEEAVAGGCVGAAGAQEARVTEVRITVVKITKGIRENFLISFSPC